MSKHTPGPWLSQENRTIVSGSPLVISRHHWIARANNNATLGKTNEDIRKYTEEADSNARLISAAPELLEALKELLSAYIENADCVAPSCDCEGNDAQKNLVNRARLAIAKAEGRE